MLITNSQNKIVSYEPKLKKTTIEEFNNRIQNKDSKNLMSSQLANIPYNLEIGAITNTNHLNNYLNDGYFDNDHFNIEMILNNKGNSMATIDIKGVEGNLIFDLNANNRIDSLGENLQDKDLFALDSNRDGLLNSSDKYFDKLQVVIKDKNSEYKMVKLSNLVSFVNLEDFLDKEKMKNYENASNVDNVFLRYIDPKYTYDKMDKNNLNEVFDTFANEDGWVELAGDEDLRDLFTNLAYEKKDINGDSYLQRFNANYFMGKFDNRVARTIGNSFSDGVYLGKDGVNRQSLMHVQKERFLNIYNSYEDNDLNISIDSKREFERITNLKFSKENLEKVKSMVDGGNFLNAFKDMDTIVAMKKDKDGSYILRFDTGRTVKVNELYSNTGDFLKMDGNKRTSILFDDEVIKLDKNSDNKIDNKEINFEEFAVKREAKMQTLKDIGVKTINIYKDNEKVQFELVFDTGKKEQTNTLYNVIDLSKQSKVNSLEELEKVISHPYQNKIDKDNKTLYLA